MLFTLENKCLWASLKINPFTILNMNESFEIQDKIFSGDMTIKIIFKIINGVSTACIFSHFFWKHGGADV